MTGENGIGVAERTQRPVSGEKTRGRDMTKSKRKAMKANNAKRSAQMRGKVSLPKWDHGAMGQANRIGLMVEERADVDPETGKRVNPNGVTGVRRVDLLEYWRNRNSITEGGYQAAVRLRDAYEATMCSKPSLPDNDRVQSSPKPDMAVAIQIDRISRFDAMMRHVRHADRQIISACVLDGNHPRSLPQFNGGRHREGFAHLRAALDYISDRI